MGHSALGSPHAFPTRALLIPFIATRGRAMTPHDEQHSSRPRRAMSRVFSFFWLTLAVAAVALAGFHVYYTTLKPSPYDLRVLGQSEWLPGTDAAIHLRVLWHDG